VFYYHKGCPDNILEMEPIFNICVISFGVVLVQLGMLKWQSLHGPQSVVPRPLQRRRFDYFQKKPIRDPTTKEEDMENCAICMNPLCDESDIPFDASLIGKAHVKPFQKKTKTHIMEAPCKHQFHIPCMVNWMQIKLECPSCRKVLEPVF
jgi:hypothetical protein